MQSYRELVAWRKAMDLVARVYEATRQWPREELYGLTNQVRRAAVSIPANIAEGQGCNSPRDFSRFFAIANGSLLEVETHLLIAQRLGYASTETVEGLLQQATETGRLINGLIRSLHRLTDNH